MDHATVDDEASIDPRLKGRTFPLEEDLEGHRAHSVFVGVHIPGSSRRHSQRRRHKHHPSSTTGGGKENGDKNGPNGDTERPVAPKPHVVTQRRFSVVDDGEFFTPPAQRVQFILGGEVDDSQHESHPLFSEMEELVKEGDEMAWKETARWVKFEEDVEEGGNRWSKPHVATLSLHSLFELRSLLLNGTVMLDMEASGLEQISELVCENMVNSGTLPIEARDKVIDALLKRHRHQHEFGNKKTRLPLIRSLADIGKNHSSSKNMRRSSTANSANSYPMHVVSSSPGLHDEVGEPTPSPQTALLGGTSAKDQRGHYLALPTVEDQQHPHQQQQQQTFSSSHHHQPISKKASIGSNAEGASKPGAGSNNGKHLTVPGKASGENLIQSPSNMSMARNTSSGDLQTNGEHKSNTHFMRKIPPGAEASNILVGEVDFLDKTLSAFLRLNSASVMGDLTEVPVPTRFIFILLGPPGSHGSFHEIGRAMATLMSDEIFHEVAYRAKKREHLLAGVDEFLDAVTVLPPGEWDPSIRIEPPAAIPSQEVRKRPPEKNPKEEVDEEEEEQRQREESGLSRTGRLFGGLINDLKRKKPFYLSDFKDGLSMQCVASWIFLYFACLSPIITFGGLLGSATGNNIAAMESLVSGFVCGIGYGFFSGQPLTILGSTGPVLVFETIVYDFCTRVGWDYMTFRFWIGTWVAIILLILVAIDASALVCYITRFTEENFACLIAFIFIYKAVENVLHIGKDFPLNTAGAKYDCSCLPPAGQPTSNEIIHEWAQFDKKTCAMLNGTLTGYDCGKPEYISDVFLMSIILFIGTYIISVILKDFKNALFFPSYVRQFVSDFAVIIAILSMTMLDFVTNVPTPKLEVPREFKPTIPDRGWLVYPFHEKNPIWSSALAILPALLGTILIFMDQQITAVIINRKEYKLNKGCGYHLDLFVLAILIQICTVMGLPWFVAATVLSINHVNSLKKESETAAPGEKPQFLGVREQRVTHILIFLTIGCSVLLTPLLSHIPMPVLYGVFLYMGSASLKGLQFFDRLLIMLMPVKYQPDYMFLRQVPIRRVHLFTLIQLACLIMLWVIKSFSSTSILFPLMLVVMIGIRKSLDLVFTRRELKILDDVMPEMTKRAHADDLHQLEDGEDSNQHSADNLQLPLENGALNSKGKINISEEVNRTTIWKQVNNCNILFTKKQTKIASNTTSTKHQNYPPENFTPIPANQQLSTDTKSRKSSDPEKRLFTMCEEEETNPDPRRLTHQKRTQNMKREFWMNTSPDGNTTIIFTPSGADTTGTSDSTIHPDSIRHGSAKNCSETQV
ncbi:electrogenic sodium bicarbonate cotransporter 1 isoform X4 [Uranotaenia lowii]|nr:electrogenic sodium bicarbonate cotransporter 1 isoform X4 [Uranotaenia lowii]XP_055597379.1 electrogenic sodium bicarbonate cotransporter 1 isoform X4 [Uranotaenia lowii]XP_055597381.1 electrogenic sodium bicarbonate cotransporter 1 isoform X4 [Uranotaenia lowii]XP_055597382.1 electrogenic sodium bicarbonate cotransporter 1 isoform X4 [Uranotaenia lowii]XP_055597383.1 electrogenic sodium bicarbonate cotransporter 1 isoform X4 [Uranotaenia lowii]XP_055597384.1 electrogenic sodium bicarbonat